MRVAVATGHSLENVMFFPKISGKVDPEFIV